jgi:GGDEF domain-containing protein
MSQLDTVKDFVARHGGDANTVIAISCLLDAAIAQADAERDALRTRLAEAESERDHASMQAGINADLVHEAQRERDALKATLAEVIESNTQHYEALGRLNAEHDNYVLAEGDRFASLKAAVEQARRGGQRE